MLRTNWPNLTPALAQMLSARPTRTALAAMSGARLAPYPHVEAMLEEVQSSALDIDDAAHLAPASLGLACRNFWREHAIRPLLTEPPPASTPGEKLLIRRLLLNDILHVLLGFAPDAAGQLGVFSFVAAQHYCPQFEWAARELAQIYITAAPWARDELADAEYLARQIAIRAPPLLCLPLEREWNTSIVMLRDRLNIRRARRLRSIGEIPAPMNRLAGAETSAAPHA